MILAGAPSQTLSVTGSNFVRASIVDFNGTPLTTTYVSATSLTATVPAAALAAGAAVNVTVTNPSPGGGTSPVVNFAINSPTPAISTISPTTVPLNQPATITLTGSGFEANSSVLWNGSPRPTIFVSSTSLTVALSAADTASFGVGQISVNNPGPGGSASATVSLPVSSPPVITAVAPASLPAGSPAQTITLTGTGFLSSSSVGLDGVALQTTFVSATSLQAVIPAADLANGRNGSLTVVNSPANGGVSKVFSLPITSLVPTLTTLSPSSVPSGSAAQITLTGANFEPNSVANWNSTARPTTFNSASSLTISLSAADLASAGTGSLTVTNPAPSGGTSAAATLNVVAPPAITALSPSSIPVNRSNNGTPVPLTITGTGFAANATATVSGIPLSIVSQTASQIVTQVPTSALFSSGSFQVVVTNPASASIPAIRSAPFSLAVIDPSATISVQPASVPIGTPDTTITVTGNGFFDDSVVLWNGQPLKTTASAYTLSAVVPAALLATPDTATITVKTPENLGAAPSTTAFSTYVALPANDIVWNSRDGLIYATVAGTGGPGLGNSLVAVDPISGAIQKTIFVGSEPTLLALSDDGTTAFVGLNGAGAVREVNLQTNTTGIQFSLGGGPGVYNLPYTAQGLAVLPGQPNSVAVYANNGVGTIYDSGVARPQTTANIESYFNQNYGALAFGASANTLYLSSQSIGNQLYRLTVGTSGITAIDHLSTTGGGTTLQFDKDLLFSPNGVVSNATTGANLAQLSIPNGSNGTANAVGPIVSDSTLNRAFVLYGAYGSNYSLYSYDEATFNPIASLPVGGVNGFPTNSPAHLIRWGQTGLAFQTGSQLFILHGQFVKDTSSAPADLKLTAQLPASATTGSSLTYQLTVQNSGPNPAQGVSLGSSLPAAIKFALQATTSQGSCNVGGSLSCDLGAVPSGASVTITLTGTPSSAGPVQTLATVTAQTFDPDTSNNQVTAFTTLSGSLYSPLPSLASLSPNLAAKGSDSFTLTVNGSDFTTASTVLWNGASLPTSFINSAQLTATVDSSLISNLGWAKISVSSAAPGGGTSSALTFHIYSLLNIPANAIVYDPFTRKLYAALPSTATGFTGNSLVAVDPATGSTGTPIVVGSEPNLLAETSSGNLLYIALSGADSIARFDLTSQTLTGTFPLRNGSSSTQATGLSTLPGLDHSVSAAGVGILDIAGSTATVRPNSDVGYNDAIFPDSSHVYTYDNGSSGAEFYRATVDASGIHPVDGTSLNGFGGFSGGFRLDGGFVYGNGGGIVNPSTTPPSQVGILPLGNGPYGSGLIGGGVVPYAAEQKSFNTAINAAGTALDFLERFDTAHFVLEETIPLPSGAFYGVTGTRWGQDGLAYVITPNIGSSSPNQIMLLRGPFVLPAEAVAHPTPTLSSTGFSLSAGSGNQYLTVTGSGFLPGATVLWNGVAHTTNFVDSSHLSVAVAAGEIVSPASVTLTCQNPGSAASAAATLTVQ